jgi:hypothetical protein
MQVPLSDDNDAQPKEKQNKVDRTLHGPCTCPRRVDEDLIWNRM